MKKNILVAVLTLTLLQTALHAQKVRAGIYAGVGVSGVKSDYMEVGILPVSNGGFNMHYGVHVNFSLAERVEIETGLQKVTKGYKYTSDDVFAPTQYTKIQCASVPLMAVVHILNYPDEVPFRFSFGLGAYGSYAVSGKITDDDGNKTDAGFSNAKRIEFGPRWMFKWEFAHKVEVYVANDMRSTNIIKNGSGYIKQGSFQAGLGFVF